jgi:HEAT repeat protein
MNRPSFDECIQRIRIENQLVYEDGYHWIQEYLRERVDDLVELMLKEQNPDIRAKFIELLGDSGDSKVILYLEQELKHLGREVRSWAYFALEHFGTPEATKIAKEFRQANPQEDFL